ncbi:MAG TPA: SDR family NAD(P)-dependent oxidoreductase, partial [Steroidobacteraceae bacterium]|nr:SDR family NAD(P)-dependent oxidoreductase [Steroidobacteraceae bacterium]
MGRDFDHSFNLGGRVAAVTGANTGLGRAIAEALAGAGADVALVGRSDPADTLAVIQSLGQRACWVNADLAKPDCARITGEVVAKLGGLHILVNNAGIIRRANAIDFTEDDWDAVLDVNLKSVFFLSQAAARHMIPNGGGKIINIASMLSFQGGVRVPSYTASKSGIAGLTRLLANEWASSGINVNAIAPGYFATNNTAALQADTKRNAEILARIPAG